MTTETPSINEGPSKGNNGEKCNSNPNDLNGSKQKMTQKDSINSPTKSPTKSTGAGGSPTKSKNKKRNEARRRNQRKQISTLLQDDELTSKRRDDEPKSPTISPSPSPTPEKHVCPSEANEFSKPPQTHDKQSAKFSDNAEKQSSSNPNPPKNNLQQKQAKKETSHEYKELKEQLRAQSIMVQNLIDKLKDQANKTRELDTALLSTTKTCNQLEQLLQQELASRNKLEKENDSLNQTISRLKSQLSVHEKTKCQNDELIRVLNATLMERETEVSILKLKLTRLQTNPSSNIAINSNTSINSMRQDPCNVFTTTGRSNSEFNRNSYIRSSMMAEAASARSSTTHLKCERDASVWATVPEELTPSKRPLLLEKTLQPIYNEPSYCHYDFIRSHDNESSTPILRDRRYRTLPRSMKSPPQEIVTSKKSLKQDDHGAVVSHETPSQCQVTNLDDSNSTNQSISNKTTTSMTENKQQNPEDRGQCAKTIKNDEQASSNAIERISDDIKTSSKPTIESSKEIDSSHYSTISKAPNDSTGNVSQKSGSKQANLPPNLPDRTPTTPVKISNGLKKILGKFRRSGSSQSKTDLTNIATPTRSPFKRGGNRSTLIGTPSDIQAHISPIRQALNFQTDKPFAEWDTDMLVDWLTMIGLSMYAQQCRRWVRCGAHIMNATPAEVDKGLGITNHLHRKKLRLAISELNGDCDKITKAAAKLDYLWVARWLDDIGLPQYKEAFINARVDGRVLNYLTVDDLLSMGVKSVLHHASIKSGIRVLRSIEFDLQLLKRRATSGEVDQMNFTRQRLNQVADDLITSPSRQVGAEDRVSQMNVPLWTCHKVMEWLRMIDFAEFAPNLRGSGVHGGLIVFEDGFNIDTMCALLSIPIGRTLLRRHLSTFFKDLIGEELTRRKLQYQDCPDKPQLNPSAELRTGKKSQWLSKLRGSKAAQDTMDEYLCPMYPVEPQIIKSSPKLGMSKHDSTNLPEVSESINV